MMTGTFIFQTDKQKLTHFSVDPDCPLCHSDSEDVVHFLTVCQVLGHIRMKLFAEIKKEIINKITYEKWRSTFNNPVSITQLIVDCTRFRDILEDDMLLENIETKCRNLIFEFHKERLRIQEENSKVKMAN